MSEFSAKKHLYPYGFSGARSGSSVGSFDTASSASKKNIKKVLIWGGAFVLVVGAFWFTKNVLQDLPDITKIKGMVFSEATTIEDRNGKVLYKLYDENREYVPLSGGISPYMVDAIIAMEDQRYREHNGLDPLGIVRAGMNSLLHPGSRVQGASTIPQQLVRNLLLTKDRKISRKLKEIILTSRLDAVLENQIRDEQPSIDDVQLRKEMKSKIMELYLNYIFFGNNAYGVEAASKTYFSKSAKDIDVLESSVLASLPKGPSVYDPYRGRTKLMGEFVVRTPQGALVPFTGAVRDAVIAQITPRLNELKLDPAAKNSDFVTRLDKIASFSIVASGQTCQVTYTNGRKDFALGRMFEDGYINEAQLKYAFLEGISYVFRKNKVDMLAPHFVQWIIEDLKKSYDTGTLFKGGITIKTSLDLDMQKLAEDSLTANASVLQTNGANNSSMIYVDSKNGDVLAYVGSLNYFDEKIQGQNDMVRNPRQSGSSVKPFIYSLGFQKLPLTIDTPIFDIPFKIGKDTPNNADDLFSGLLPLKYALARSRNIPAIKMITALGGEEVAKPFLKKLGLTSLGDDTEYGYTLALGAGEVTMLELAEAYTYLSAITPAKINPILEIRSRDGSLIYEKTVEVHEQVIEPGIVSLIWKILSDPANRLAGWVSKFNVPGLTLAIKTGTSNAKTDKGNLPRDGWMAAYTPSKVALFWAGNADATPMNRNAFGGTIHANPMKTFFTKLVKNNFVTNEQIKSVDTANVSINKITGKIANEKTPSELVVNTSYFVRGVPLGQDAGAEQFDYDVACNGQVTQNTPAQDIKKGYFFAANSFMPNNMDLAEITTWFKESTQIASGAVAKDGAFASGKVSYNFTNFFVEKPTATCEGREEKPDTTISVSFAQPADGAKVSHTFPLWINAAAAKGIDRVIVFVNNLQVAQFPYRKHPTSFNELKSITLGKEVKNGAIDVKVAVVDAEGFSNTNALSLVLVSQDTQAPTLLEQSVKVTKTDAGYLVSFGFQDELSSVLGGKITKNGEVLGKFDGAVGNVPVKELGPVVLTAEDAYHNVFTKTIDLNTYMTE